MRNFTLRIYKPTKYRLLQKITLLLYNNISKNTGAAVKYVGPYGRLVTLDNTHKIFPPIQLIDTNTSLLFNYADEEYH